MTNTVLQNLMPTPTRVSVDLVETLTSRGAEFHPDGSVTFTSKAKNRQFDLQPPCLFLGPPNSSRRFLTTPWAKPLQYPDVPWPHILQEVEGLPGTFREVLAPYPLEMHIQFIEEQYFLCAVNSFSGEIAEKTGPLTLAEPDQEEQTFKTATWEFYVDRFCDDDRQIDPEVIRKFVLSSQDPDDISNALDVLIDDGSVKDFLVFFKWTVALLQEIDPKGNTLLRYNATQPLVIEKIIETLQNLLKGFSARPEAEGNAIMLFLREILFEQDYNVTPVHARKLADIALKSFNPAIHHERFIKTKKCSYAILKEKEFTRVQDLAAECAAEWEDQFAFVDQYEAALEILNNIINLFKLIKQDASTTPAFQKANLTCFIVDQNCAFYEDKNLYLFVVELFAETPNLIDADVFFESIELDFHELWEDLLEQPFLFEPEVNVLPFMQELTKRYCEWLADNDEFEAYEKEIKCQYAEELLADFEEKYNERQTASH